MIMYVPSAISNRGSKCGDLQQFLLTYQILFARCRPQNRPTFKELVVTMSRPLWIHLFLTSTSILFTVYVRSTATEVVCVTLCPRPKNWGH